MTLLMANCLVRCIAEHTFLDGTIGETRHASLRRRQSCWNDAILRCRLVSHLAMPIPTQHLEHESRISRQQVSAALCARRVGVAHFVGWLDVGAVTIDEALGTCYASASGQRETVRQRRRAPCPSMTCTAFVLKQEGGIQ